MTRMDGGADGQAAAMGGDVAGYTGTATASSATSLTGTSTPFVASAFIGHIVVATSASLMYGVVTANTTSVLTVDQWYAPGSPGGAAVGPPTSTTTFVVLPGQAPYWYMALGATSHSPFHTDTTLSGEITTTGGGLIRKLATYAHTTAATSYTLAATFTANGSDSLGSPVTIFNIGLFNTLTGATGRMQFQTALSPTATISASGDSLTVTDTISM
jgi:hypothetical protein